MKAQILENLIKGSFGFGLFLRLVFSRVLKVITLCLLLTLIVWFVWLEKYTWGSFLAGAAFGSFVFWILYFLKGHFDGPKAEEGLKEKE